MRELSAPDNGLQNKIFSYRNIYEKYLACRKNKRNSINALRFERNAEENIAKLEEELKSRTYHPSRSILFAARKPKLREIFAANFKDRIVHHILVTELEKTFEPIFIYDSYASRKQKGTHIAVKRLQKFQRQITKNGNVKTYFLQLDIKDFFISIDKNILFNLTSSKVKDKTLLWLTQLVIFWDCTKSFIKKGNEQALRQIPFNKSIFGKDNLRGLPIGNLTSQFFANIYLNELDQFIKRQLKVKYYLRYVDDFVLLSRDKEKLLRWKQEIEVFLARRLNLQLHPRRQKLQPVSNGVDFLGYIVRHNYILIRRRVISNLKSKLNELKNCPEKLRRSIASYLGHFKWANSYRLIKKLRLEENYGN